MGFKNFLIVATQRTGSSALVDSIGLNPKVSCGGEIMTRVAYGRKLKAAKLALGGDFSLLLQGGRKHMDKKFDAEKPWLGFRWLFSSSGKWIIHPRFSPALWVERFEDCIRWLTGRPDTHIIHIVRRQGLDWLKSLYLAKETKFYKGSQYPDDIKVRIPKREAIYRLRAKNWVDSRLFSLKNTNPYLCLEYESFLANQNAATASVLAFLQCDPTIMSIGDRQVKKQSKGAVADYVVNFAELVEILEPLDLLVSNFDRH